jgi:hypothetical protein
MAQANEYKQLLKAAFALKLDQGAGPAEVAAVATRAISSIALRLNPIVGKAGVVALYKRSIHLASLTYPWLSGKGSAQAEINVAALGPLLAQQGASGAAEAGTALLQTFCDLLASLVGMDLTHQLLDSVWADL